MSTANFPEEEGEGYFASVSDLMVGILFVFLLMLTVFALNLRDTEEVSKQQYEQKRAEAEVATKSAKEQEIKANEERRKAEVEHLKNDHLRDLLRQAVTRMSQDIEDRQNARRRLVTKLTQRLKDQGVTVIPDPDSGVLRLPESLLFEKGQWTLGSGEGASAARLQSAQAALNKISDSLATVLPCFVAQGDQPGCEARDRSTLEGVLIEGHSDRQGYRENGRQLTPEESRERNDRLSVERALTVFKEIQQRNALGELKNANGLPLIAVSAYGDRRPVALKETEDDYQKNRRIDLRFLLSSRTSDELQRLIDEIKPALGEGP